MRKTRSQIVIALVFLVYGLGQLLQVPREAWGDQGLPELAAFHAASGLLSVLVTVAIWRGFRWTWVLALVWGGVAIWLVLSLPRLLQLPPDAAVGMPLSAAIIGALAVAAAWYLHRSLARER